MPTGTPEPANEWLELVLKSVAVLGIAGGLFAALRVRVARAFTAARAAHSLADIFGDNAGSEIQRLFAIIARSDGEQQLRQRVLESHLRIGVYECDLDGKWLWVNPHLAEMFGIDERNMRGYGWLSAIVPEERVTAQKSWRTSIEHGIPYEDIYTVENQRTRSRVRCRTRAELVKSDDVPLCFVGWVTIEKP